jgi:hypothetical protein
MSISNTTLRRMYDSPYVDSSYPLCELCDQKPRHPDSPNHACASCELKTWSDELKDIWLHEPTNAGALVAAETEVRVWMARVKESQ